jgi:low affinity Fe/Cu permease
VHHDRFDRLTAWVISATGHFHTFLVATISVLIWALAGPFCHWSELWQLTINTATTIVTFLMVFLIQAAQNRDSRAIHLKLDELILSIERARNEFTKTEQMTESQLNEIAKIQSNRDNSGPSS